MWLLRFSQRLHARETGSAHCDGPDHFDVFNRKTDDLADRLPSETLEGIDEAVEKFHPALGNREDFGELAVAYALGSLREGAAALTLALEDE